MWRVRADGDTQRFRPTQAWSPQSESQYDGAAAWPATRSSGERNRARSRSSSRALTERIPGRESTQLLVDRKPPVGRNQGPVDALRSLDGRDTAIGCEAITERRQQLALAHRLRP